MTKRNNDRDQLLAWPLPHDTKHLYTSHFSVLIR